LRHFRGNNIETIPVLSSIGALSQVFKAIDKTAFVSKPLDFLYRLRYLAKWAI